MRRRSTRLVPAEVARAIGPYYVYVLVDPRDGEVFYVGKGTGDRLSAHGREADLEREKGQTAKTARIHAIRAAGLEPRVDIVRHGIEHERDAFMVEAALIDSLNHLSNVVAGHGAGSGRTTLDDLVQRYGASDLAGDPPVPAMMIRLTPRRIDKNEEIEPGYFRSNAGWFPGISRQELYDATRAWWKVSPTSAARRGVTHVVAVVHGVTRSVYEVNQWIGPRDDGRWAFAGQQLLSGEIFDFYLGELGRRVPFAKSAQNPITYWPSPTG